MVGPVFTAELTETENAAWLAFKAICTNFLGRAGNYCELVEAMLKAYKDIECNMYLKMHFFHSHLEFVFRQT